MSHTIISAYQIPSQMHIKYRNMYVIKQDHYILNTSDIACHILKLFHDKQFGYSMTNNSVI